MATEAPRKVGNYSILETLGKGGYSWVKKGLDAKSKRHVALKFMARANNSWAHEQAEQVRTEIKSLTQIRHDNVMKLYAYNLNAKYPEKTGGVIQTILLVLEYCPGGELFDILYYTDKLDAKTARTYFQMLIKGIQACHNAGVCHRDIKPQNLLLDRDYNLKLTDFGLSKIHEKSKGLDENVMSTTYVGTRGYQAPELLAGKKYGNSCDIFSAGVVLFILLTGYPPFDQGDKKDKWYRPLYKGQMEKFWAQHDGCGVEEDCKSLIEGMLCYKPNQRITIDDIMKHKWYNQEVYSPKDLKSLLKKRHAKCMEKRDQDAAKQKDLVVSVKKRDIPREYLDICAKAPEEADMPIMNTIVLKNNPFASIWRAKELLEMFAKAKVKFSKDNPFEMSAVIHDAGTINLPAVVDDEEEKDSKDTKEVMNVYTINMSVRVTPEGVPFIQFKRGYCSGQHAMLQIKKIMSQIMTKMIADKMFSSVQENDGIVAEKEKKKEEEETESADLPVAEKAPAGTGLLGMVAGICAPSSQTVETS